MADSEKELQRVRRNMLGWSFLMDAAEIVLFLTCAAQRFWLPIVISIPILVLCAALISNYYCKNVIYVCPHCHKTFKPVLREVAFLRKSPGARDVTCPHCKTRARCVEKFDDHKNRD